MKIALIPDIHGRNKWIKLYESVISESEVDKIVFLGDYCDSFYESDDDIYNNLKNIITFKRNNPDEVVLLLGNHDVQYLYDRYHCSGYRLSMQKSLQDLFTHNKDLFTNAWAYNNILFTHAGVTEEWLEYAGLETLDEKAIEYIINNEDRDKVYSVGSSANGRSISGPMWARPSDYIKDKKDPKYIQIVGHTEIEGGMQFNNYFILDTLPTLTSPIIIDTSDDEMVINYETIAGKMQFSYEYDRLNG